jgi:hypothetical protein
MAEFNNACQSFLNVLHDVGNKAKNGLSSSEKLSEWGKINKDALS